MLIDLATIRIRLFQDPVREAIMKDYGLSGSFPTPQSFADALIRQLGQAPSNRPLSDKRSEEEVFCAAVKAIASSSRRWVTFIHLEPGLKSLLQNYSPHSTALAIRQGVLSPSDIVSFVPGQSQMRHAEAICCWASLLDERPSFYVDLYELDRELRDLAERGLGKSSAEKISPIILAAVVGADASRGCSPEILRIRDLLLSRNEHLPGMGYTIAVEFLRNLGWSAFKPDRHIRRLFCKWCPAVLSQFPEEWDFVSHLLGRRDHDLAKFVRFSLAGMEITPEGVSFTEADRVA